MLIGAFDVDAAVAAASRRVGASIDRRIAEFKALCRHGEPLNRVSAGAFLRYMKSPPPTKEKRNATQSQDAARRTEGHEAPGASA